MKADQFEKPEGFQEHHRRKGDRQRAVRGAETIIVDAETHKWIEEHPEEARKLGWSVSRSEDPLDVPVVIPAPPKERKPRGPKKEKARDRSVIAFRVPKDNLEDGAGLFDDLWEQASELLERNDTEGVTTEGATGQYGQLLAVLYFFNVNYRPEQEES